MALTLTHGFRITAPGRVRRVLAFSAVALCLISVCLVGFAAYIYSSFIRGLSWYEPCGLQVVALIVPIAGVAIIGVIQRVLSDRAGLLGPFGPYSIYSAPLIVIFGVFGGIGSTALSLLWAGLGLVMCARVAYLSARAPGTQPHAA